MIKFDQVSFQYPNTETAVLRDVNLTIFPGTLTLLSGASGSGKSTLLRCINGLVPHFTGGMIRGKISVFNSDPIKDGEGRFRFLIQIPLKMDQKLWQQR